MGGHEAVGATYHIYSGTKQFMCSLRLHGRDSLRKALGVYLAVFSGPASDNQQVESSCGRPSLSQPAFHVYCEGD